jgi:dihydrofolate reductase
MIGPYVIHGYAIVSTDDRIAGPDGRMPPALYNDADWALFQAALQRAAVTVLGRLGHEQNANKLGRNRLVVSSSVGEMERRANGIWWNPATAKAEAALAAAAPGGGTVAVVGGRRVFDLFLEIGFDEFHLTRMARVVIPGGIPVFSGVDAGRPAEEILAGRGLVPGRRESLDKDAEVTLVVWTPPFPA